MPEIAEEVTARSAPVTRPPNLQGLGRLLVVSSATHYDRGGTLAAYGPYAREIDIWADLFEEVVIAAPCHRETPPNDCVPFTRENISMMPQRQVGGDTLGAKLRLAVALPAIAVGLARAMLRADAIHVRCPGNLGLLGAVLGPLFSRRLIAKYAGQWNGYAGESLPSRFQRWVLRSSWWRGPVTVYGEWPNQPRHVIPFFTSMMTTEQVEHAAAVAATKRIGSPLRVLFAGALHPRKRVDALIDATKLLVEARVDVELVIVGDGAQRQALHERAGDLTGRGVIRFVGALPFDESLRWYEWAHCLVLPSQHTEGWPKVVAEGMSYGLVCIAVAHGHLPRMLAGRGLLLETGSPKEIAEALLTVSKEPERCRALSEAASTWACQFSLQGLRKALADLLREQWNLNGTLSAAGDPAPIRPSREVTW